MNYEAEVLAFSEWVEFNPLPASAIALWHGLMHTSYKTGWQPSFTSQNGLLQAKCGLSRREFDYARQLLISRGRIRYKRSDRVNQAGIYSLIPFVQNAQQNVQQDVQQNVQRDAQQNVHSAYNGEDIHSPPASETEGNHELSPPGTEPSRTKIKRYIYQEKHLELAKRLESRILESKPNYRVPKSLDQWSNTIRLMMDQDKRTSEQITKVIDWCQKDKFWSTNILSADSLREQFDRLELQMGQKSNVISMSARLEKTDEQIRHAKADCPKCGGKGKYSMIVVGTDQMVTLNCDCWNHPTKT